MSGRFVIFSEGKVSKRVDLPTSQAHIFSRARGASGRFSIQLPEPEMRSEGL